ncbi:MAG TPA: hypothetical protein VKQ36_15020 [Ktedonobacterales bacterium]|nr:hypothetical protein [Ktedonobacterales bacterium]
MAESAEAPIAIERVQIGARMEKRLVKVLRALADYHDMSLGDLLEGIVLHVFEHRLPFGEEGLQRIAQLKAVYGVDYGVEASHHFIEPGQPEHLRHIARPESEREESR